MKRGLQTIIGLSVTLTLSAHAQNNSWISPDSGFWDTSNNWSLAKPPATTQSATFITNANTKLVTIDATTVNNFPGTLTISNLTVQGVGVGANNTLRLQNMNNAISPVPLRILKDLLVNSGGRIEINNSTLRVDGTGVNYFRADGGVSLNSGSVIITNRTLVVGALAQARGSFTNSGGTLLARDVWVGEQVGTQGTLAIAGGTTSLSSNLFAGRNAGATGTVWLTGGQLFTTNFPIFIGETGVGRMTVSDGTWQANEVDVGQNNGSQGTLTIAGGTNSLSTHLVVARNAGANGTVWLTGGQLLMTSFGFISFIGFGGTGQMTVSNGTWQPSEVDVGLSSGSQGTLTIAGGTNSLSSVLYAGHDAGANGTVWLTGGQLFTTNTSSTIGYSGVGRMTVSNGTWQANEVDVGQNNGSQGTLTFAGGTNSLSPNLIAGYNAGANGTVWLTGGQLFTTNSSSYIGFYGVGRVTVSNGTWQAGTVELGFWPGAQGTLTVAGGTTQLSGDLRVSDPAPSAVWVTAGQLVATNGGIWVCNYQAGVGQVTVSNGTLQAGTVRLGCVAGSQGTLTIAGGTNSLSSDLYAGYIDGATGTVWLTGGQLFTTNSSSYIGYSGVGRMTVSNGTWKAGGILVGFASHGTLTFAGGTNSLSSVLYAGCTAGVTGTVWLTGGQLFTMNSSSEIGYSGVGRMTVSNGTWQAGSVYVSLNAGSQGMLTITGGTSSVYNFMQVGRACTAAGTVTVTRGSLYVTNAAHTAYLDLEDGQVTVSGGLLVVDKIIVTNACGRFNYTGGTLQVTSLDLSPALDADADGLPNGWEQAYGLDPLSSVGVNGPGGDPDGDGLSNSEEYQLGTAPRDSSDPYRITSIVREANNIRLIWQTVGGKINVVQVTKGAAGGSYSNNFTDLSATIVPDGRDVTTTNYLDVGGATNFPARYYRIRHD